MVSSIWPRSQGKKRPRNEAVEIYNQYAKIEGNLDRTSLVNERLKACHSQHHISCRIPEGGGGGGRGADSYMKQTGMLVVSLRGVNFGFWSRLGSSGESANILCRQGLV